jgi:RimJ/RimL family protein N-acetyltransferase
MVTIDTPRLRLRSPEESDAVPFLEIHQDPEAAKYVLSGNPAVGPTTAWRVIAMLIGHWHLRGYGQWTVIERATEQVVGRVGLWNPEGWPGIELGWIIRRSRWNNGFATEAASAALEWAWANVKTDHIISMIQPGNTRSIRVAEKIGQTFESLNDLHGERVLIYGVHRTSATGSSKFKVQSSKLEEPWAPGAEKRHADVQEL